MIPPHHPLSEEVLGYQIHTNRELGMMLRRTKPLSVFGELDGNFTPPLRRYLRIFDLHVQAATFVKREHIEPYDANDAKAGHHLHMVLFALPTETWRIDAMIDLHRKLAAWTPELERMEGTLLGYADWQNDAWIAARFGTL